MQILKDNIKKVLFFDHWILEWSIRILITLNIVLPAFPFDTHYYLIIVLGFTAIGFWLYIGKLKVLSLVPLLFALFITYMRLNSSAYYE